MEGDGYAGRHRPIVAPRRSGKGGRARRIGVATVVLIAGTALAAAGMLARESLSHGAWPKPPAGPSLSISDDPTPGLTSGPSSPAGPSSLAGPAGTHTVSAGPAPPIRITFDVGTGPLTLCGGTTLGPGHESNAGLRLERASGCASMSSPIRTDASFTVAAWVNLDPGAGASVALAQEGTAASGFYLMYEADGARWCMRMPRADLAKTEVVEACAAGATPGRWTHLVGVYDAPAKQVRLHVDGRRAAVAAHPGPAWRALGYLDLGRARHSGGQFYRWGGSLDDVVLHDNALPDNEIGRLYRLM